MSNVFRWTALCLFFLNLSYFAWALTSSNSSVVQVRDTSAKFTQSGSMLRLLSELSSEDKEALTATPITQEPSVDVFVELASEPYCPSLGPFEDKAFVQKIGTELANNGLSVASRSEILVSGERFRVYLPAYADRNQAADALKKLRAKKIDSYIMSEDGFDNAISLGIFSLKDSAEGLVKKMNSYGYQAQISPSTYNKEVFWIEVKNTGNLEKVDEILVSVMTKWEGITRVDSPCKVVALTQ
jgi:hypothetical protein